MELTNWQARFRHRTEAELRFGDTDTFQHINNANYLSYLEQARLAYFGDVMDWDGRFKGLNMILARVEVDFLVPLLLNDRLVIYTRCSRLGGKSYDLEYVLCREGFVRGPQRTEPAEPYVKATARTVMVFYNLDTGRSEAIPDDYRRRFLAYEPGLEEEASTTA